MSNGETAMLGFSIASVVTICVLILPKKGICYFETLSFPFILDDNSLLFEKLGTLLSKSIELNEVP